MDILQSLFEIISILDARINSAIVTTSRISAMTPLLTHIVSIISRVKEVCKATCGFCGGPADKPPKGGPTNKPPTGGLTNKPPTGYPTDKPPTGKPGNSTFYNSDTSIKLISKKFLKIFKGILRFGHDMYHSK